MSLRRVAVLVILITFAAAAAWAQSRPIYLQFDPYTVKGALYRPDSGDQPTIGVLLIHRVNNYLGHLAASELARRGFLVLAMNSRFDNNEAAVLWEQIALDVKTGVEFLKRQAGVRTAVLFGHSGGAATLSFYQAVAEKGTAYCDGPGKLTVCGKELSNLPRADALILVDASIGNPAGLLRGLNPAVVTEGDPKAINPALDPFNQANGYNPAGSTYTAEFKQKYYEAQAARMNRLIAAASAQASQLGSDRGPFPDDNVFFIVRAQGDPLMLAPSIREQIRALDPNVPLSEATPLQEMVSRSVARPRFYMSLLTLFAAVALALSATGIFGVMSYAVAQQSKEIGNRIAHGARATDVLRSVVLRALALAGLGVLAGLVVSLAFGGVIRNQLFGVTIFDPTTLGIVVIVLLASATIASLLPAVRAARIDPVKAFREV